MFHRDKPIAGVDISTTGLKIMAINPHKMSVLGYGTADLDPHKVQDSLAKGDTYLAAELKKLLKNNLVGHLPSDQVAISVPTNRTFSRIMSLPLQAEGNLNDAVRLEVEQYIPVAPADLYIDYEIIERTKDSLTALLSAVPKIIVDSIMGVCAASGLKVVLVEPGISAAARLVTLTEQGNLPSIIVDIGAATTDVALLDGVVRVTGGVPVGGHTFTLKISEKLKVGLEEAHQLKVHSGLTSGPRQSKIKSALGPSLDQIVSEARKVIRYYNERLGAKTKIEQVVVVGGGASLPGIGDYLTEAMMMPARPAEPWQSLHFGKLPPFSRQARARYITAAGLALAPVKEIWL